MLPSIGGEAASPVGEDGTAHARPLPEPAGQPVPAGAPASAENVDGVSPPALYADSEDAAIWSRFVRDYLMLLDERVATIRQRLAAGDDRGADTALMSLEATSAMLGASELVAVVGRLRAAVSQRLWHQTPDLADALVAEAAAVRLRFTEPR